MSEDNKPKRGRGRPPKAGNRFNLSKFKSELPEITEVGDLIKAGTMSSIMELIKLSLGQEDYKDASCTNRLGAHKELLALGLKFLDDDIVSVLENGAVKEREEVEKVEEEPEIKSENVFTLKTFKG